MRGYKGRGSGRGVEEGEMRESIYAQVMLVGMPRPIWALAFFETGHLGSSVVIVMSRCNCEVKKM